MPGSRRGAIGCATVGVVMLLSCAHGERTRTTYGGSLPAPPAAEGAPASVRIIDPLLAQRITSLGQRSATWQAAMDTLRATGFDVVIAQPAQIRAKVPGLEHYAAHHLGEVLPQRDERGRLTGAVVTIDLPRLRRMWQLARLPPSVLTADIERILIHEIYGHVVPLAQSRRLSGGCPDPRPGQPPSSSCAIRRENRIRAELGLESRTTYDLRGLATGRALEDVGDGALAPDTDNR